MAGPLLRRSRPATQAVAWLPPRPSSASEALELNDSASLTIWSDANGPRHVTLGELAGVRELALVFDARDVLLIPAEVPALSGARLEQALPNLIEDVVLQEAQTCRIAIGPTLPDGRRLLGVIDRVWYDAVASAFQRRGIRLSAAWPAQLVIPWQEATWSIALVGQSLTVRCGAGDGFGFAYEPERLAEILETLWITAQAAQGEPALVQALHVYGDDVAALTQLRTALASCGWAPTCRAHALGVPVSASLDLVQAVVGRTRPTSAVGTFEWAAWRWPSALALACGLVWMLGLNLQWARLASEASAIDLAIEQRVRAVLPPPTPIVDPLVQLQRRLDTARVSAGEPASDDAVVLLTRLSQALGARANDALRSLEYRDGRLRVKFQPGWADATAARQNLRETAASHQLRLRFDESDGAATVSLM